ncbi:PEP-CTERM sorting domain-containing protein [Duganella sp. CY15W]|uniref:CCXG family PEP-CTERM protein n=1 Tax=Duganella sp. CY15W TaxID=2692172 RepID=UPI00136B642B|nr:CCXG family PEP-CTERM protein [Duganella sp. CY15W]MYM26959.1 PEP-CTERM sorting domain-containing protein [Duganella sp. CY15W]
MKFVKLAALAVAMVYGSSEAAVITFQTGYSNAGVQATANDYRDVVNAAVASSPYGSTVLSSYDNVSNNAIFGAGSTNIAFKSTINFGVGSGGTYSFRAGVDFGNGGAVFLDGQSVALTTSDMWWAGSYSNTGGIFAVNNQALSAGNHTLTIYGLEGCCDGGQQVQYAVNGGAFQSFNNSSLQLAAAVPEPETYAMLLGGLGVVGAVSRRRRKQQA